MIITRFVIPYGRLTLIREVLRNISVSQRSMWTGAHLYCPKRSLLRRGSSLSLWPAFSGDRDWQSSDPARASLLSGVESLEFFILHWLVLRGPEGLFRPISMNIDLKRRNGGG